MTETASQKGAASSFPSSFCSLAVSPAWPQANGNFGRIRIDGWRLQARSGLQIPVRTRERRRFLVLSAKDEDSYLKKENEKIKAICPLNSAATLSFSGREDSEDPKIAEIIAHAESIFIAGGDQSDYVRFWQDTPVEDAINRHIAAGKPLGTRFRL